MPWEFLFDPIAKHFIGLSINSPIVRSLDLPTKTETLAVKGALRVLVMISSPKGYPELDVAREWNRINEATAELQESGRIILDRLPEASLPALQRALRKQNYHIFHFIGHGGFDESKKDGVLVLEGKSGKGKLVSGSYLGTLLHDEDTVRLAVLNACNGARTSISDPFAGVGQSLLQQGVPAVIAMQFEITDDAAITFANEFYAALVDGYPIDASMVEARKMIFAENNEVEWATPVLYMNTDNAEIFSTQTLSEEIPFEALTLRKKKGMFISSNINNSKKFLLVVILISIVLYFNLGNNLSIVDRFHKIWISGDMNIFDSSKQESKYYKKIHSWLNEKNAKNSGSSSNLSKLDGWLGNINKKENTSVETLDFITEKSIKYDKLRIQLINEFIDLGLQITLAKEIEFWARSNIENRKKLRSWVSQRNEEVEPLITISEIISNEKSHQYEHIRSMVVEQLINKMEPINYNKINRKVFFEQVTLNLFNGKLTATQKSGINIIMDEWEKRKLTNLHWLAYILATAYHESAHTFQPLEEYGKGKGRIYGGLHAETGKSYYGRGLIGLTWYDNYKKVGDVLGINLVNKPELALEMDVSTKILFEYLILGFGTGKALKDYFNDEKTDWYNARRVVNGLDSADKIGNYGKTFWIALSASVK